MVIGFGLFHGLVFLPVLLSLIGPQPYSYHEETKNESTAGKKPSIVELKPLTNGNGIGNGHSSSHKPEDHEEADHQNGGIDIPEQESLPSDKLNSVDVRS